MPDVIVVGAGVAGLVCAADLIGAGREVIVLESGDRAGGRVASDALDGYVLDRGFQILLTAYPQVKQRLAIDELDLGTFAPGAAVYTDGGWTRLADPLRRPRDLLATLRSPVANGLDELRAARLVADVCLTPPKRLLRRRDMSTAERLRRAGFSPAFIDGFWRPFFAGIQLDPDLEVSSRRFEIILRMLALGGTGLPRQGIGAVAAQLAARVPAGALRLRSTVSSVKAGAVTLADGETLTAAAVVVAAAGPNAHELLGADVPDPGSRPVAALWFGLSEAPRSGPLIMLDGTGSGPASNVVVMSEVQPAYAPPGRSLVVAAVPGPPALEPNLLGRVTAQLSRWFALSPRELEPLRQDVIAHGQPLQTPPLAIRRRVSLGDGVFVCGDHRDTASLQGAMFSGERTARAVQSYLAGSAR